MNNVHIWRTLCFILLCLLSSAALAQVTGTGVDGGADGALCGTYSVVFDAFGASSIITPNSNGETVSGDLGIDISGPQASNITVEIVLPTVLLGSGYSAPITFPPSGPGGGVRVETGGFFNPYMTNTFNLGGGGTCNLRLGYSFTIPPTGVSMPFYGQVMFTINGNIIVYATITANASGRDCIEQCPNSIVTNGSFTAGLVPGHMPTASVSNWSAAYTDYKTPDVGNAGGCEDSGFVMMWGNQLVGEAIQQTLATPIQAGKTYRISVCYRWIDDPEKITHVRFKLRASNKPLRNRTSGTVIGSTPNTSLETWTTVTLPDWTADSNYTILTVGPENNSNANRGDSTSFGAVDNVCMYIVPDPCETDTLLINTGYNHAAGAVYPAYAPGAPNYSLDNYWRLVSEPQAAAASYNSITPRLSTVRIGHSAWTQPQANSQWISSHPINNVTVNGDYIFRLKFCLKDTLGSPYLYMKLYVDDDAKVQLNGYDIGQTPMNPGSCAGMSCNFQTPNVTTVTSSSYFHGGDNYLDVIVHNRYSVAMGLNVQGYVIGNGASIEKMHCCSDSGSICGVKWLDRNGDGQRTSDEPGIANWPIHLKVGGVTVQSTMTDNFGFYNFTDVAVGSYMVEEGTTGGGCNQTYPAGGFPVSVTANAIVSGVNFGNRCDSTGTICITKFNDFNRNGIFDPTDSAKAGWLFTIDGVHGASGTTDEEGKICIPVFAGTYTVNEFLDPDWVPTTPYSRHITVGVGETVNLEFGNVECPATDSVVFNTGWNNDAHAVLQVGTVDNEWYVTGDPDITTTETRPAHVIPTYDPVHSWTYPQANSQWISSYANADYDVNGLYQFEYEFCLVDSLEASLCMSIRADDTAAVYLNGHFIGSTGTYTFTTWKNPVVLCTANPLFFRSGKNTIHIDLYNTHNVAMGVNVVGRVNGKFPRYICCCSDTTSGIMGRKWNDVNGDGVWNAGEQPLQGWEIELSNGMTTTTDALGNYYFLFLHSGTYEVTEVAQPGWASTYPSSGIHSVELGSCQIATGINFGNRTGTCVTPPPGMVAWWKLNETSGTTFIDIQGVYNNATGYGSPAFVAGKVSNALYFNGSTTYLQVSDHAEINFGTSDFSFDGWIRTNDAAGVNMIVDKRVVIPAVRGYAIYLEDGALNLQLADGSSTDYSSGSFVADSQWHHIAVTVNRDDSAGVKFYVDGALENSANPVSHSGTLTNPGVLKIGTDVFGEASTFRGTLDELELFNRALTPTEVRSLWQADYLGKCITIDSCLNFGQISPCKCAFKSVFYNGDLNPATCVSGGESPGQLIFSADPNSTILLSCMIPTLLTDGSNTVPISSVNAAYSTTGVSGIFTEFNPSSPVMVTTGSSGDVVVRFGGVIWPAKNIPGGIYTGVIYLSWEYTAAKTTVASDLLSLCVTAEIPDVNCCVDMPNNMVAWWQLNENSGTISTDYSGFPNNGTHVNAPTPTTGKVAGAFAFNGIDEYIQVADHNEMDIDTSDFTIDAWVKTTDSTWVSMIVDKRTEQPTRGYCFFLVNGKLSLQMADGAGSGNTCDPSANCTNFYSNSFVADGLWHHIAVTVDRDNTSGITFYKDGVADPLHSNPTVQNLSMANTGVLRLGARSFNLVDLFEGILDEVEIFKRALSADEIKALYMADSLGKCKGNNSSETSFGIISPSIGPRWTMISIPVVPDNYDKWTLFPDAESFAFLYNNGYQSVSVLDNARSYWLKFPGSSSVQISGQPILTNSFTINAGWNMVGSISAPVDVSTPSAIANMTMPPGIIISNIYVFEKGYATASAILPGKGYWVKASQDGTMLLDASLEVAKAVAQSDATASLARLNKLTMKDAAMNQQSLYFGKSTGKDAEQLRSGLPPVPPDGVFDARFATQRIVELYDEQEDDAKEYTINLSSVAYPLTVTFEAPKNIRQTITLSAMADGKLVKAYTMNNHGTVTIQHQAVNTLIVNIARSELIPNQFSLYQCYPNPFNPLTTINFDISVNSVVSLKVYDILGREVASLIDRQAYEPGAYQTVFDAGNLATGLYFYRITAQSDGKNFVDVKKMMLMK